MSKPGPRAFRCDVCVKTKGKCGVDRRCLKVKAGRGAPLSAATSAGAGEGRGTKRARKQPDRIVIEGDVEADRRAIFHRTGPIERHW